MLLSGYEGLKAHEATIPATSKIRVTEAGERIVQLSSWAKPEKAPRVAGKTDTSRSAWRSGIIPVKCHLERLPPGGNAGNWIGVAAEAARGGGSTKKAKRQPRRPWASPRWRRSAGRRGRSLASTLPGESAPAAAWPAVIA